VLTLKLALRNVFRQYGRTTLSMVSIIFGVAIIILGRGFVGGVKENVIRAQVDSMSGHVLLRPARYPDVGLQHPVDKLLTVDGPTRAWLDENTQAWTRRTLFVARVVHEQDALRVRVIGFNPDTDSAVFPRKSWHVEGALPYGDADGVVISPGVARIFDVAAGDSLVFQTRTADGAINAMRVQVTGVLRTGNPAFDGLGALMAEPLVRRLVVTGERFSHLAVRLDDRADAGSVAAALDGRVAGAEVRTWVQETAGLLEIQDLRQRVLDIIALVLMAIAATGIANTVLMAAYERIREIGTLRAMGLTRRGVVGLFMTEGAIMGVVGSAIGAILGGAVVRKYATEGIDLTAAIQGNSDAFQNIPMSVMLYLQFSNAAIVGAVIFGVVVAVAASIYPAVIASRMRPSEAVRAS